MPGILNTWLALVVAVILGQPFPSTAGIGNSHTTVASIGIEKATERLPLLANITKVLSEKRTETSENGTVDSQEYVDEESSESNSEEANDILGITPATSTTKPLQGSFSTTPVTQVTPTSPTQNGSILLTLEERSRLVKVRGVPNNQNWFSVKNNKVHSRSIKLEDVNATTIKPKTLVGANRALSPGALNLKSHKNKPKATFPKPMAKGIKKKIYSVVRAKPKDTVDPDGYNFFQFRPDSSLGWLYLTQRKLATVEAKLDLLGSDQGLDADFNDPANFYDWEFRRYDRACLHVEYLRQKNFCEVPVVDEEVKRLVDVQNEKLARRYLDWQFVSKESADTIALQERGDQHPLYMTYKFLNITMEIFRDKICRNATSYPLASHAQAPAPTTLYRRTLAGSSSAESKLLPREFIEEIFRLFLALRDITLPKNIPDYPDKLDKEDILEDVLLKCGLEEESILWFSHSCGDQILSDGTHNNFACSPLVDYDFNTKIYDPILDGMWHMFTAVHSYCFKHFNQLNTRLWHKYALIMTNAYTLGMRQRWTASVASHKFYVRLLGPDYAVHLETMNRCMFGATLRSDFPAVIPRFDSRSTVTFGQDRTVHKDGAAG